MIETIYHPQMPLRLRYVLLCFMLLPLRLAHPQGTAPSPAWQINLKSLPGDQTFALNNNVLGDGKQFTAQVRLRPGALRSPALLLHMTDSSSASVLQLEITATSEKSGPMLRFLVTSDFNPAPLSVGVPVSALNLNATHQVTLRDLGFRLDFFVDGVLADQEWPAGTVAAKGAHAVVLSPGVDAVRVWSLSLADAAIVQQNGGATAIASRDQAMFGPPAADTLQYFRPRGYNTSAGDAMPFFHDGVLHVFYLLDRRHHRSKWGLGAHQWGHAATTDLVHWEYYPPALTIDHEWEASICTGSVFFEGGKYYAFYATRMPDRSEHLAMAVSEDAIHFQKLQPTPFALPMPPYRPGPNRDPFVFGKPGDFHMLVTASLLAPATPDQAGVLEHLTSTDLKTWTVAPQPFLITGYHAEPECSDLFFWHGWYYLFFSVGGRAHYRMSRNQLGPWTIPPHDLFDGAEARVMKTAAFRDDRRIGVAFVPDGVFGGQLLFREIIQNPDGSLHTTFVHEMTPHGAPQPPSATTWSPAQGEKNAGRAFQLQANTTATLHLPPNYKLSAVITPATANAHFGFRFNTSEGTATSNPPTLDFTPMSGSIAWLNSPAIPDDPTRLDGVDLHGPIHVILIAKGDIIDLEVNGRHTLVHRITGTRINQLAAFSEAGQVDISDLAIESIAEDH